MGLLYDLTRSENSGLQEVYQLESGWRPPSRISHFVICLYPLSNSLIIILIVIITTIILAHQHVLYSYIGTKIPSKLFGNYFYDNQFLSYHYWDLRTQQWIRFDIFCFRPSSFSIQSLQAYMLIPGELFANASLQSLLSVSSAISSTISYNSAMFVTSLLTHLV